MCRTNRFHEAPPFRMKCVRIYHGSAVVVDVVHVRAGARVPANIGHVSAGFGVAARVSSRERPREIVQLVRGQRYRKGPNAQWNKLGV